MAGKATARWRPAQICTAVLVILILVLTVWAMVARPGAAPGGCSVMLPVIHVWMDYPAAIAVGTTLFAVIFTALSGGYGHLIQRNVGVRAFSWLGSVSYCAAVTEARFVHKLLELGMGKGPALALLLTGQRPHPAQLAGDQARVRCLKGRRIRGHDHRLGHHRRLAGHSGGEGP